MTIAILWVACGVLAFQWLMGLVVRSFGNIDSGSLIMGCFFAITGPIGLFTVFCIWLGENGKPIPLWSKLVERVNEYYSNKKSV